MPKGSAEQSGGAWKTASLLALVVVAVGVMAWLSWRSQGGPRVQADAVCLACQAKSTVEVGETPGREEWPRECPQCHARQLYMSRPCPRCGQPLAFKDPAAEKFGQPTQCPHCRREVEGP